MIALLDLLADAVWCCLTINLTPDAGHPAGVHSPGSASGVSLPAAGNKRATRIPEWAPAKAQPGRECATRSAG